MQKKTVVIVVTYNGMKWYENCFESLRNSSIPVQTIVIDNNSSDDTVNYIKTHYPEIYLVESKTNLGFGKANNIGLEYALEQNANYIYLLNQDAWIKPNTIKNLVEALEQNSSYGIISPLHISKDEENIDYNQIYHILPDNCPDLIEDYILGKDKKQIYQIRFVNAAHWLISANCLADVGGFSSLFFLYGEDNDYINRAVYWGYNIGICPHAFAIHDRLLKERNKNDNFAKKVEQQKTFYSHILANINKKFSLVFRDVLFDAANNICHAIIFFQLRNGLSSMLAILKTIISLPKIRRHRNINRNKRAYLQQKQ